MKKSINALKAKLFVYALISVLLIPMTTSAEVQCSFTIGDYVWNDTNGDGIQDVGEAGVLNVPVLLFRGDGTALAATNTDANGLYQFICGQYGHGDYYVQFILPAGYAFSPKGQGGNDTKDSDADLVTGKTDPINVTVDGDYNMLDAGIFPFATVGDLVWDDTNKDGVQDIGEPGLSGVTVNLHKDDGTFVGTTTTNPAGFYQFTKIAPGDYYLDFILLGGYTFSPKDQDGNDDKDSDADPTTGKTITTNLSAYEIDPSWDAGMYVGTTPTATWGDFVWNDLNKDGIQDPGEPGISGVKVELWLEAGTHSYVYDTQYTDGNGYYLFTINDHSWYHARFSLPANYVFSPKDQGSNDEKDSDADPTWGGTDGIEFDPSDNVDDLTWDAGMIYSGDSCPDNMLSNPGFETGDMTSWSEEAPTIGVTTDSYTGLYAGKASGNNAEFYQRVNATSGEEFTLIVYGKISAGATTGGAYLWFMDGATNKLHEEYVEFTSSTYEYYEVTYVAPSGSVYLDVGVWVEGSGDGYGDDLCLTSVPGPPEEEDCCKPDDGSKPKPQILIMEYTGEDCSATNHDQDPTKVGCSGDPSYDPNVYIISNDNDDPNSGNIWFSGNVVLNSTYYIDATNAGETKLPPNTVVHIFDQQGGTLLQKVNFHTSCSQPLRENNDQWGANKLLGIIFDDGYECGSIPDAASLGDFVWNDTNKNGIQEGGELGATSVTVNLFNGSGSQVNTTTTNGSGYYLFDNLIPGDYFVEFVLPNGYTFSPKDQGTNDALDSDANISTGRTAITTLIANEHDMTWDAGMYDGCETGSIGDYVWFDEDYNGVQDDNFPSDPSHGIEDVKLTLYDGAFTPLAVTYTNSAGWYLFTDLPAGDYVVEVDPTTLPSELVPLGTGVFQTYDYDGVNTPNRAAVTLEYTCGGTDEEDCCVYGKPQKITMRYTGEDYSATSHTQDPDKVSCDGDPNYDSNVYIISNDNIDSGSGKIWFSGPVALNGNYVIDATAVGDTKLPPNTYVHIYDQQGGTLLQTVNFHTSCSQPLSNGDQWGANKLVSILFENGEVCIGGDKDNLDVDFGYSDISLPSPASIGDFVWHDLNENGIQDDGATGLPNVTVKLYTGTGVIVGTKTTNASGYYLFDNLTPGDYFVEFTLLSGYTFSPQNQGTNDALDSDANTSSGRTITTTLIAGENDMTWDAGMYEASPELASIGDFVWHDIDQDGIQDLGEVGIQNVTVKLYTSIGALVGTTTTNSTGYYLFDNLTPGNYMVEFTLLSGYTFSSKDQGTDDAVDSDANTSTGLTIVTTLDPGENDMTWDAGMYIPSPDCTPPTSLCTLPSSWDYNVEVTGTVEWNSLGIGNANDIKKKIRIYGDGTVIVPSGDLNLKDSDAVLFVDGPTLVVKDGKLKLETSGANYTQKGGALQTKGNFEQKENTVVCISDADVEIGEEEAGTDFRPGDSSQADWKNDGGYRYLENNCINVTHDFKLEDKGTGTGINGVDVFIDNCMEIGDEGANHATPTAFGTADGDDGGKWEAKSRQYIFGTTIVLAKGNFTIDKDILTVVDAHIKVNKDGDFEVKRDGTLDCGPLCVAVENEIKNNGTWLATGLTWYSKKKNTTNVPGAGPETDKTTILSSCFDDCECYPEDDCYEGSIGDYVWYDEDYNGEQDDNFPSDPSHGIEDVKLTLYDGAFTPLAVTYTNAAGWYLFTDLAAGDYFVEVDPLTLPAELVPLGTGVFPTYDYDGIDTPNIAAVTLDFDCGGVIDDCCDFGKPQKITMRYTGEYCDATSHTQDPDKVSCTGDPDDFPNVYIISNDDSNPSAGNIWFSGPVTLNGNYVIDATAAGETKLPPNTYVHIFKQVGGSLVLLQTVNFHTSCSQPLNDGDQWGANKLMSILFEGGEVCIGGDKENLDVDFGYSDIPLPVTLSSFTVTSNSGNVEINWVTESEIENQGFLLERRIFESGDDWKEISSYLTNDGLQGQGSVTHSTSYEYMDQLVQLGLTYEYRLGDVDYDGIVEYHSTRTVTVSEDESSAILKQFTVKPAYPNPFNPSTTMEYAIPKDGRVSITIYDLTGQRVSELLNTEQLAGWHKIRWNGNSDNGIQMAAGIYLVTVNTGNSIKTMKLVFVK